MRDSLNRFIKLMEMLENDEILKIIKNKKVLITGIDGSVGTYLQDFLQKKKINVYGTFRNKVSRKEVKKLLCAKIDLY